MDQEMQRKRMEAIEAQTRYNIERRMKKLEHKKNIRYKLVSGIIDLILMAALSACAPKKQVPQENAQQVAQITSQIGDAQDEVIIEYIDAAELQCENYMSNAAEEFSQQQIQTLYNSYYAPAMQAYTAYIESNEIDRKDILHDEFIKEAKEFDREVSEINTAFAFDNSIYSRAKYIDGEVCIPYVGDMDKIDGYEYHVDPDNRNVIYIPLSQLKEEEKTMK